MPTRRGGHEFGGRALRLIAGMVTMAITVAACELFDNPTLPPSGKPPTASAAPGSAQVASGCAQENLTSAKAQPYLDAPAPDRNLQGAGGEEEEPNENEGDRTADNQDGVVPPITEALANILPPTAQENPQPEDPAPVRQPTVVAEAWQIAEPNVAASPSGSTMMTWNMGAARSFGGSPSLRYMDPWNHMLDESGNAVDGGFCCDQLAQYVPELDLWIWVLQSKTTEEGHRGGNRIRVFFATGDQPFDRYWDLRSGSLGLAGDPWLDQPKIGVSDGHLFLSVNAYPPNDANGAATRSIASVVARLPFADLERGIATPTCVTTIDQLDPWGWPLFGPAPVRRAAGTMYLGAHFDNGTLAVWRWPDEAATPSLHLVRNYDASDKLIIYPGPWKQDADDNYVTDADGNRMWDDYRCPPGTGAKTGADWCNRSSDRIGTAWYTPGRVGFAWNAGQDRHRNDPARNRPFPFVWVVILDESRITSCESGGCTVATPHLASDQAAFQYAAIGPNARGDLGMVVQYGGGGWDLSCAVATYNPNAGAGKPTWPMVTVGASDIGPPAALAGDYLNIAPGPSAASWVAGCITVRDANGLERPSSVLFNTFSKLADAPG